MVDQLSAKWLECGFDGCFPTPNIDRLRQNGTTFTNAFSSNPVCLPTRATIATGMTSRGHGVLENGYRLDPEQTPTFMQELQKNGWHTGAFGKMHFTPHYETIREDCEAYGFDISHVTQDPRAGEWLDWVEECHPEHYEAALSTAWGLDTPAYHSYGKNKINLCERIQRAKEKFDNGGKSAYPIPFPEEVSQSAWITQHAKHFIESTPKDTAIFAHISYVAPHSDYCPPESFLDMVDTSKIPTPVPAEWLTDPNAPTYFADKTPSESDWFSNRHHYFADIVFLDKQLGKIYESLEKSGRLEDSYIMLISDHGDLLGDHGFYLKEEKHYDACIRVPLIISGPLLNKNKVCEKMVQMEDICPTILKMAQVEKTLPTLISPALEGAGITAHDIKQFYGDSLLPLCRGEDIDWKSAIYVESYNSLWSMYMKDWARTVRTARYRYTVYPDGVGDQLFDLKNDPDEQHNLVKEKDYQEIRTEMRDRLFELVIAQDYPKTTRNLFSFCVH